MLHHVACSLRGYYGNMTLTRVDSVAVGSLQLFEWDHTRSQEKKAFNDFTASIRDGAGTCVSGDSAQGRRLPTGISAGALGASHAGQGRPSPPESAPSHLTHETSPQTRPRGGQNACRATATGIGGALGVSNSGRGGSNQMRTTRQAAARADVSA